MPPPRPFTRRRLLVPLLLVLAALGVIQLVIAIRPRPNAGPLIAPAQRAVLPADLALPILDGSTWRLAAQRGTPVLANFFATWCAPCRSEIPDLAALAAAQAGRLQVVGIAQGGEPPATLQRFVESFPIRYPVLVPAPRSPWVNAVSQIPTTMLIDASGHIAKVYYGATPRGVFEHDLAALRAEPAPPATTTSQPATAPTTPRFNPAGTKSVSLALPVRRIPRAPAL